MENSTNKKVAFIIAFKDFKDEEYFKPKEVLEKNKIEVVTVSSSKGQALGKDGGDTSVDILLDELKIEDYQAIAFIGGSGARNYIDDPRAHKIARETVEAGKILAAICIAPTILAKAGVLKEKQATVIYSDPLDRSAIKILEENGAVFVNKPVVRDGQIITANGPAAAEEFGNALVRALAK